MFGLKKLMKEILENEKIQTRETVKQTDLLEVRNQMIVELVDLFTTQNLHLRNIASSIKQVDEFNRNVYQASSGYEVPEGDDPKGKMDFQNSQGEEREAVNEMYYSDMNTSSAPIFDPGE